MTGSSLPGIAKRSRAGMPQPDLNAAAVPIRCLECGAESAEAVQICARCGAPITQQRSMPADPATGQAGHSSSRRWLLILAAAGVVVAIAVAVVIAASTSSSSPLTWDQVQTGDCLQGSNLGLDTDNPWPDNVTKVPCTQQHIAEVFFAGNVWPQSLKYPGDNAVSNQADDHCASTFTAYDGIASDSSEFTYKYFQPGNTTWTSGDRAMECIAYKPTDQYPGGAPVDYSIKVVSSNGHQPWAPT
jgi:hypothetical protein